METNDRNIAMLIDAENISPKYIGIIIDEANKHGKLNHKRIYGDWTTTTLKKWKTACQKYALQPVQQFASVSGKNASDFSLVIDAMDILYSEKVSAFCIVSSDGDFTKLTTRLKEDDMYVFGMGEEKTPSSLVNSYEDFIYLDTTYKVVEAEIKEKEAKKPTKKKSLQSKSQKTTSITSEEKIIAYVKILINDHMEEDGWALFSIIGGLLKKRYPGFDPRNYGKNLRKFTYFKTQKDFKTKIENKVAYIRCV